MPDPPLFPTQPLDLVRKGMHVVDEGGRALGKVVLVHSGDPEAVTVAGNEPRVEAIVVPAPPVVDEQAFLLGANPVWGDVDPLNEVPEPVRKRLERTGFVQVDGPDLHGLARFIGGDAVVAVSGETVTVRQRQP